MNELLSMVDATGETRMKIEQAKALFDLILNAYYTTVHQNLDEQASYNMHTLLDLILESLNQAKEAERIADALFEAAKQPADEAHAPACRP